MLNEGNNFFGEASKILLEPAAEGSVLLCPDGNMDFDSDDDKRFDVFFYNKLSGDGGDPPEIEEFFPVLAIHHRIAEYFIVARGKINAELAFFLQVFAPKGLLNDCTFQKNRFAHLEIVAFLVEFCITRKLALKLPKREMYQKSFTRSKNANLL
ncbi:hypothetical protein D3C73_1126000 [compost metagenome]